MFLLFRRCPPDSNTHRRQPATARYNNVGESYTPLPRGRIALNQLSYEHLESISCAAANDPEFKAVKQLCDMKKNEEDAYGDGDQSPSSIMTRPVFPGEKVKDFHELRARGINFNPNTVTKFMQACLYGDLQAVKDTIEGCDLAGGPELVHQLVNRLESLLRMSPLLGVVCGSKLFGGFMPPRSDVVPQFEEVIEALIEAGSKVDAKDCAGFSTIHHATSGNCTEASLRLLPILVKHGADPNALNRFGDVAMAESTTGRPEAVRSLFQVGAKLPNETVSYAVTNPAVEHDALRSAAWPTSPRDGSGAQRPREPDRFHFDPKSLKMIRTILRVSAS